MYVGLAPIFSEGLSSSSEKLYGSSYDIFTSIPVCGNIYSGVYMYIYVLGLAYRNAGPLARTIFLQVMSRVRY